MTTTLPAFGHVDFGPDDAKDDLRLSEYFIKTPEYERVRRGTAWLVIGRKGTGKTAICQMIHDEALATPTSFAVLLSFKNQPSTDLLASNDKAYQAPNQYISVWRFLIALETCKLALKDESIDITIKGDLSDFLRDNFGNLEVSSVDTLRSIRGREWKVGLTLPIVDVPVVEALTRTLDAGVERIHYGQAATALIHRLQQVRTDNTFYLLFDDLDEDYSVSPRYFHLLISLLKAAYQVRLELTGYLRVLPVVALRDDVFDQLDDHDLNKFDEQLVRLRWSPDPDLNSPFSLRRLVNARISAMTDAPDEPDYWTGVVEESAWGGPDRSAWSFLVNRTMDRPRDVLKSVKACQPFEQASTLGPEAIKASMRPYSEWLYRELANEVFRLLPNYRLLFSVLGGMRQTFTLAQWRTSYRNLKPSRARLSADEALARLYDFSVIGSSDARAGEIFKYRMPQLAFEPERRFVVHPGLRPHLALPTSEPIRSRPQ